MSNLEYQSTLISTRPERAGSREKRILYLTSYAPSTERPRAYNILRGLARHFRVSLIAQVRSDAERDAAERMRSHCDSVEVVPLSRRRSFMNCLRYLATPVPLRAAYFFNPAMDAAIRRKLAAQHFDLVHVEHMMAAHFAAALRGIARSFDTIDSIARLQSKILRLAHSRLDKLISLEELAKVRRYEPRLCRKFDCVLTSTELDRLAIGTPGVRIVPNGVDLEYYRPMEISPEPDAIIFYGRLSYIANSDAITYFVKEVLPLIRDKRPRVRLYIVGPSTPKSIERLSSENLIVTGRVDDVRPWVARASVAVCPVRFAVGTQNKILEPMAMGVPVVATPEAIASLPVESGRDLLTADSAEEFADQVLRLLGDDALRSLIIRRATGYVRKHHDWRAIVDNLAAFYVSLVAEHTGAD